MGIQQILKPKSKEDIDRAILDMLDKTPTLPEFLRDFELFQYMQVVKAYDYIRTTYLKAPPDEIFIVYHTNPLYEKMKYKLRSFDYTNQVIKNIKFVAGPYSHALIKKNSRAAELFGGTVNAVMIPLNRILDLLLEKK